MNDFTKSIRVVDFCNTKGQAELAITKASNDCKATLKDWMEKDYGVALFYEVPNGHVEKFKSKIANIHGATYSE